MLKKTELIKFMLCKNTIFLIITISLFFCFESKAAIPRELINPKPVDPLFGERVVAEARAEANMQGVDYNYKPPEYSQGEIALSAFERENTLASSIIEGAYQVKIDDVPDPDFDVVDYVDVDIRNSDYAPYWKDFIGVKNYKQAEALKTKIYRELNNQEIIKNGRFGGFIWSLIAKLLDPFSFFICLLFWLDSSDRSNRKATIITALLSISLGAITSETILTTTQITKTWGSRIFVALTASFIHASICFLIYNWNKVVLITIAVIIWHKIKKFSKSIFEIYEECLKLKIKSQKHFATLLTTYILAIIGINIKILYLLIIPYFLFYLAISIWVFNNLPKRIMHFFMNFDFPEFNNKFLNYLVSYIIIHALVFVVFIFILALPICFMGITLKIPYLLFK